MSRFRNINITNTLKIQLFLIVLSLFLVTSAYAKATAEKATETEISLVDGIAVDKKGNIYIAIREHNVINRIDTKGMMTRYAGSGESGFSGDGGPAVKARLKTPANLTFDSIEPDPSTAAVPHRLFNIGNNQPTKLMRFIEVLEESLGQKAIKDFQPMQPGDVIATAADTKALEAWVGFQPSTSIEVGIARFAHWYKNFYGI